MDALMHNPNTDYLYLNDMIGPGHPAYEEMKQRYANTPEGKRIEAFRAENEKYMDGLEISTHSKLDNIIRNEHVAYNGDPLDRLAKIREIRIHRSRLEEETLKQMTKEERVAYLAEAKAKREEALAKAKARLADDAAQVSARQKEREAKRTALEEARYKRSEERRATQEKNRAWLDEEAARRTGKVDPVTARKNAIEERERKEKEMNDLADPLSADASVDGTDGSDNDGAQDVAAVDVGDKAARSAQLAAMGRAELNALVKEHNIALGAGWSNLQKAEAILNVEFPE